MYKIILYTKKIKYYRLYIIGLSKLLSKGAVKKACETTWQIANYVWQNFKLMIDTMPKVIVFYCNMRTKLLLLQGDFGVAEKQSSFSL